MGKGEWGMGKTCGGAPNRQRASLTPTHYSSLITHSPASSSPASHGPRPKMPTSPHRLLHTPAPYRLPVTGIVSMGPTTLVSGTWALASSCSIVNQSLLDSSLWSM